MCTENIHLPFALVGKKSEVWEHAMETDMQVMFDDAARHLEKCQLKIGNFAKSY